MGNSASTLIKKINVYYENCEINSTKIKGEIIIVIKKDNVRKCCSANTETKSVGARVYNIEYLPIE